METVNAFITFLVDNIVMVFLVGAIAIYLATRKTSLEKKVEELKQSEGTKTVTENPPYMTIHEQIVAQRSEIFKTATYGNGDNIQKALDNFSEIEKTMKDGDKIVLDAVPALALLRNGKKMSLNTGEDGTIYFTKMDSSSREEKKPIITIDAEQDSNGSRKTSFEILPDGNRKQYYEKGYVILDKNSEILESKTYDEVETEKKLQDADKIKKDSKRIKKETDTLIEALNEHKNSKEEKNSVEDTLMFEDMKNIKANNDRATTDNLCSLINPSNVLPFLEYLFSDIARGQKNQFIFNVGQTKSKRELFLEKNYFVVSFVRYFKIQEKDFSFLEKDNVKNEFVETLIGKLNETTEPILGYPIFNIDPSITPCLLSKGEMLYFIFAIKIKKAIYHPQSAIYSVVEKFVNDESVLFEFAEPKEQKANKKMYFFKQVMSIIESLEEDPF